MLSAEELAAWYPVASPFDDAADRAGHVPYALTLALALALTLTLTATLTIALTP